ncbi:MAG: DUF2442 domain-containing protein [Steroidobacteraceae bacterium]
MRLTDEDPRAALLRKSTTGIMQPRAAAARYDRKSRRILILLTNDLELSVPVKLTPRLAAETATDLEEIEISPAGLVLRWPKLDADLYLPSLLGEMFGSRERRWRAYWAGWGEK